MKKGWGKREGLSVASVWQTVNMQEGQMWAKNWPEGSLSPLPQFYVCFKNASSLTTVQLFEDITQVIIHTVYPLHYQPFPEHLDLTPPIIPFKIEFHKGSKRKPQGHKDLSRGSDCLQWHWVQKSKGTTVGKDQCERGKVNHTTKETILY